MFVTQNFPSRFENRGLETCTTILYVANKQNIANKQKKNLSDCQLPLRSSNIFCTSIELKYKKTRIPTWHYDYICANI